jgi:hypothetical protein
MLVVIWPNPLTRNISWNWPVPRHTRNISLDLILPPITHKISCDLTRPPSHTHKFMKTLWFWTRSKAFSSSWLELSPHWNSAWSIYDWREAVFVSKTVQIEKATRRVNNSLFLFPLKASSGGSRIRCPIPVPFTNPKKYLEVGSDADGFTFIHFVSSSGECFSSCSSSCSAESLKRLQVFDLQRISWWG